MKREIKFRIWDGSKMEYSVLAGAMGVVYVNPANGGVNPRDTACITPFNTIYPDGIEVMQYTGLLDKNGQEIYEGDLLKYATLEPAVVEYWGGSFGYWLNKGTRYQSFMSYSLYCFEFNSAKQRSYEHEVIGNIHDNPELVK